MRLWMCKMRNKTKLKLKILVGIITLIPFVYAAAVVYDTQQEGWWICIVAGIGTAIYITKDESKRVNYD